MREKSLSRGIRGFTGPEAGARSAANQPLRRQIVKPEEIRKLEAYFKRNLNKEIVIKARPRKDESAEVYLADEFLGVIFRDDEDGELSYNFSMAILDIDL